MSSSFNAIMSNGMLGMYAQTHALGTISDNIANARTVGYKRVETQFQDIDLNDRGGRLNTGAGVSTTDRWRIDQSNGVAQTGQTTNAAIIGTGFFMVQDISGTGWDDTTTSASLTGAGREQELTRAGDFIPDQYGHLVNSAGRALLGVPLSAASSVAGNAAAPSVSSLQLVSTRDIAAYREATTRIAVGGNLAATGKAGEYGPEDGITQVVSAVDSAGRRANIGLMYTRTATATDGSSTWQVSTTGARYSDDGTAVPGSGASVLGNVIFGPNGELTGGAFGTEQTMALNAGSGFSGITLSLGNAGQVTGLHSTPGSATSGMGFQQNGVAAGSLKSIDMTDDGYITGTFGEGQTRYFFRVPNAIVTNPTDLTAHSGTTFTQNEDTGDVMLKYFGAAPYGANSGAGSNQTTGTSLGVGMVEQSGTQIEREFTNLIVAQRSYSAASKIISTADEMTQTAMGTKA
jgi:flagellar hook protein FlgE